MWTKFKQKLVQAGRGKQTKEFLSHADGPASGWVLGLKLYMHKDYFQLPELRLKCVSTYHDIIKEYQTHLNIYFRSYNAIEAQSTVSGSHPSARLLHGSSINSLLHLSVLLSTAIFIFTSILIFPSQSSLPVLASSGELLFTRSQSNDGYHQIILFTTIPALVIFSLCSPQYFIDALSFLPIHFQDHHHHFAANRKVCKDSEEMCRRKCTKLHATWLEMDRR